MSSEEATGTALHDVVSYEDLFHLNEPELVFFQSQTGIQDAEELKKHIIKVQAEALKVTPYTTIKTFAFTKLVAGRIPGYSQAIQFVKGRKDAIWLDVGCCFGVDVRKAVADGMAVENAIGTDLYTEYWTLGHQLFRTTPESYPAPFVGGDIFDENILKAGPVLDAGEVAESPRPELASLKSLTPLNGHVTVIHTSSFFHLFSEEQQLELAQKMAGLLSPVPGSTIFGMHAGLAEKGFSKEGNRRTGGPLFCHSPDSWKELWNGGIFKKGTVKVEATLQSAVDVFEMGGWKEAATKLKTRSVSGSTGESEPLNLRLPDILQWSVTRL